jgi:hypothetical protein
MRKRSKLLIAAITAIALLGMAVSSASAGHFEISNWERGFRIAWNPLRLTAGSNEIDCPVTLEGTFRAHTFAKIARNGVGSVTSASLGACTRGTATILTATLPWEVSYQSFAGTLPNITSVTLNLIRASFNAETGTIACLARTESGRPARGIAEVGAGGAITGFEAEPNARIETSGSFFCNFGGEAGFAGRAASTTVGGGGTEAITIRLI